jgi:hypothetical protein
MGWFLCPRHARQKGTRDSNVNSHTPGCTSGHYDCALQGSLATPDTKMAEWLDKEIKLPTFIPKLQSWSISYLEWAGATVQPCFLMGRPFSKAEFWRFRERRREKRTHLERSRMLCLGLRTIPATLSTQGYHGLYTTVKSVFKHVATDIATDSSYNTNAIG